METAPLGLIAYAFFEVMRDKDGPKHCRKKVVGPVRKRLETPSTIGPVPAHPETRRDAMLMMERFCHACGQCELGWRHPVA